MTPTSNPTMSKTSVNQSIDDIVTQAGRLFDAARPEAVFAEPVVADGRTIIAAAEVLVGAGFGGGGGSGPSPEEANPGENTGLGGGGGGFTQARPVAVIIIDGDGVRVEPVVDATKLGLAAITVLGSLFFFLARMLGGARRG